MRVLHHGEQAVDLVAAADTAAREGNTIGILHPSAAA